MTRFRFAPLRVLPITLTTGLSLIVLSTWSWATPASSGILRNAASQGAAAAAFTVDVEADAPDADPGDGLCLTDGGHCTLRAAVQEANLRSGPDEIVLPAGRFRIDPSATDGEEGDPAQGDLDVTETITIVGDGADRTVLSGGRRVRVLDAHAEARLTVRDLSIVASVPAGTVGAVRGVGGLTLSGVHVVGNDAAAGAVLAVGELTVHDSLVADNSGIGISVLGTLDLRSTTVRDNGGIGVRALGRVTAQGVKLLRNGGMGLQTFESLILHDALVEGNAGTGVDAGGGTWIEDVTSTGNRGGFRLGGRSEVVRATVQGNHATSGGGISGDDLVVRESLIVGNRATTGGAIRASRLHLVNSTVYDNSATAGGAFSAYRGRSVRIESSTLISNTRNGRPGGFELDGAAFAIRDSIFVRTSCAGISPVNPEGHNLADDVSCGIGGGRADRVMAESALGLLPLAERGGPTWTFGLAEDSPAIDTGSDRCPAHDQRGFSRPAGAGCDIGALERGGQPVELATPTPTAWATAGQSAPLPAPTIGPMPTPTATLARPPLRLDSTADSVDVAPGDGRCADDEGRCTLRAAVQEANALPGRDRIDLPVGEYRLTLAGRDEDAAATGDLDVRSDLHLAGAGAESTIVDAVGLDRVLHALPYVSLNLSDLTVRGGDIGTEILAASGIQADRDLHLQRAVVSGNEGHGIGLHGGLTLHDVIVANNSAAGIHLFGAAKRGEYGITVDAHRPQIGPVLVRGGEIRDNGGSGIYSFLNEAVDVWHATVRDNAERGIQHQGPLFVADAGITGNAGGLDGQAQVTIHRSRVEDNQATSGGGINASGQLEVVDSLLRANRGTSGGAIAARGTVRLVGSTLDDNRATSGGGMNATGALWIENSTFRANSATGGGAITGGGVAMLESVTIAGGGGGRTDDLELEGLLMVARSALGVDLGGGRQLGCAPSLLSLGHNHLTDRVCPARTELGDQRVDRLGLTALGDYGGHTPTYRPAPGSLLVDGGGADCPPIDQRGHPRPHGAACDVGAVELAAPPPAAPPVPSPRPNPDAAPPDSPALDRIQFEHIAGRGGTTRAVVAHGHRAWLGVGAAVAPLHADGPALSIGESIALPGPVDALAATDSLLVARYPEGVAFFDIVDDGLSRATLLPLPDPRPGEQPLRDTLRTMAVAGDLLVVVSATSNRARLLAAELSGSASSVTWAGELSIPGPIALPSGARAEQISVATDGRWAWVGLGGSLWSIDLADPHAPTAIDRLTVPAALHALAISGEQLLATSMGNPTTSAPQGLLAFDLIEPEYPVLAAIVATDTPLGALTVAGSHVFAARLSSSADGRVSPGIERFDASQLGRPSSVGGFDLPQGRVGLALALAGDRLHVALAHGGAASIPAAYEAARAPIAVVDTIAPLHDLDVADGRLVAVPHDDARGHGLTARLQLIDIADPYAPAAGSRWTPSETFAAPRLFGNQAKAGGDVVVRSDTAFVTPVGGGPMWAIDIGHPDRPTLHTTLLGDAFSLAWQGDRLAVGGRNSLHLVEVGAIDTGEATLLSSTPSPIVLGLAWSNEGLWSASDGPVVMRWDVAASAEPRPASAWGSGSYGVRDSMAVVPLENGRVAVAEGVLRTAELGPGPLGRSLDAHRLAVVFASARDIVRVGRRLFVAGAEGGVWAFEVGPQGQLVEVGYVNTPGSAQHLRLDGDLLYVADGDAGLQVFRWSVLPWQVRGRIYLPRAAR